MSLPSLSPRDHPIAAGNRYDAWERRTSGTTSPERRRSCLQPPTPWPDRDAS